MVLILQLREILGKSQLENLIPPGPTASEATTLPLGHSDGLNISKLLFCHQITFRNHYAYFMVYFFSFFVWHLPSPKVGLISFGTYNPNARSQISVEKRSLWARTLADTKERASLNLSSPECQDYRERDIRCQDRD